MTEAEMNQKVHELLARKSTPVPPPDYFRGVMVEFHRRQRAELLKPSAPWLAWFKSWEERLASALFPNPQTAFAALAAVFLVVGTMGLGIKSGIQSLRVAAPSASYAFEDLRPSGVTPSEWGVADKSHDRVPAHYVFEEGREGIRLALAF
jgi:hypothetical protein